MSANASTPAPTGRKKLAQGKEQGHAQAPALGHNSPNTSSPEGAKELPADWKLLPFDEAVEPVSDAGKRVDRSDYLPEGELPVVDQGEPFIGGYTNDSSRRYDGPLPVVVFGDHTRRVKLVDFPFVVGAQGVKILRPRECWQPKFFAHLLPTLPIPDRGYGRHYQFVRQLSFPCPPIAEQTRIVAEIEKQFTRLEVGVAALRRVQANLKRYRAAVLKAACEGKLVATEAELSNSQPPVAPKPRKGRSTKTSQPASETGAEVLTRILAERRKNGTGRGKYKEPATPTTSHMPSLPLGWCYASLEQLTSADRPICYGILMPKENVVEGVLYVKVKDMKGDKIYVEALHRTTKDIAAKYARAALRAGDLLLAIRGTYGRVAEVPKELDGGNITQDTARLDVSGLINHQYVATCLRNPDCQNYFKRVARGVAVKGVNIRDVRLTPIPLPPLAEQKRIVTEVERRLSVVQELESMVSANLQRATRLRQSILQKAFTGNL